jgi:hypothetical protein
MLRSLYQSAAKNNREVVRAGLIDLLAEYRPAVPAIPAQAAPYADDY